MKTIQIDGLENRCRLVCTVDILSPPQQVDPTIIQTGSCLTDQIKAVSPNAKWMAIQRFGNSPKSEPGIYIERVSVDESQWLSMLVVFHQTDWQLRDAVDVMDNSTVVLSLNRRWDGPSLSTGFGALFSPTNQEFLVLPPGYEQLASDVESRRRLYPEGHQPICLSARSAILGNTLCLPESPNQCGWLVWKKQAPKDWEITYLPKKFNGRSVMLEPNGQVVWSERDWDRRSTVHFGEFDGHTDMLSDLVIPAGNAYLNGAAEDGSCIGRFAEPGHDVVGSWFLARPREGTARLCPIDHICTLDALSPSGEYVVGRSTSGWLIVLHRNGERYSCWPLETSRWQIHHVAHITDEGHILATATCVSRDHGCYRLRLPVLITPQW